MDNLYIVMPAYNEEANIEDVVKSWYAKLEGKGIGSKLIISDSGSTDSTHKILTKLKEKYEQIEILSNTAKQHGPKIIALYDFSIKNGADYIFQTDSDGQTDPKEFDEFWELRHDYDIVLGNRKIRGDGKFRALVEKIVCLLLRIYFGVKVSDANAPFRLMKTNIVKKYLYKLPYDYNLPNIMMTTFFTYNNEKIIFKQITFKPRQGGINSIDIFKIVKIGWKALGDFKMLKKKLKY